MFNSEDEGRCSVDVNAKACNDTKSRKSQDEGRRKEDSNPMNKPIERGSNGKLLSRSERRRIKR